MAKSKTAPWQSVRGYDKKPCNKGPLCNLMCPETGHSAHFNELRSPFYNHGGGGNGTLAHSLLEIHTDTHTHTHTYSTCDLYVGGMRSTGRLLQGHLSLQYSCEVGGGVLVSPTWTVLDGFGARPGLESSPQTMSSSIRKWLTR